MVKTRVIRLRMMEGPNARDQIALCAFHSFLVATYDMRRMRNDNLEIRITGFSCRPLSSSLSSSSSFSLFLSISLLLCIYSQYSTGNQFPVQVTSCNLSTREPIEGVVLFLIKQSFESCQLILSGLSQVPGQQ